MSKYLGYFGGQGRDPFGLNWWERYPENWPRDYKAPQKGDVTIINDSSRGKNEKHGFLPTPSTLGETKILKVQIRNWAEITLPLQQSPENDPKKLEDFVNKGIEAIIEKGIELAKEKILKDNDIEKTLKKAGYGFSGNFIPWRWARIKLIEKEDHYVVVCKNSKNEAVDTLSDKAYNNRFDSGSSNPNKDFKYEWKHVKTTNYKVDYEDWIPFDSPDKGLPDKLSFREVLLKNLVKSIKEEIEERLANDSTTTK